MKLALFIGGVIVGHGRGLAFSSVVVKNSNNS